MSAAGDRSRADDLRAEVVRLATETGTMIATAESLTGGALVAALVDVPGASRCVAGGAACYTYEAKARLLGVDAGMLAREGAVTAAVARDMARGALAAYDADLAVATTGVAGPGADERGVPAGTVHLAIAWRPGVEAGSAREERAVELHLSGDRSAVRSATVRAALDLLAEALGGAADRA